VETNNNAPSSQSQSQSSLPRQASDEAVASVHKLLETIESAPPGHWDEMRGGVSVAPGQGTDSIFGAVIQATQVTPHWAEFLSHLGTDGIQSLPARHDTMMRQVRDNGMTYNVYANADQPQRPWSLDLLPLMLSSQDWQQIQTGVLQRMRLLEGIMSDVYGMQHLLKKGALPYALVQGHPGYLHAMQGSAPVGGRYLNLAAFDLVKGPDGCWWLLSQRTQAPSGLGYLLENRQIISNQFSRAFESMPVRALADSYRSFVNALKLRTQAGMQAHIALLTPGPYNETYFEQAYLARYLGLSLVQGNDLLVRDEKLYLKTLEGLKPVHGLLKRVDDDWLDPLELRAESTLGIPGLLQAVRAGNVLVANTPGSGFLESNALLGFLPELSRTLLQEELLLPAIPSWWCGEPAAMHDVLPRLQDCVIKPTYPYASGRKSFEPVMGHKLDWRGLDEWRARIQSDPEAHTVQGFLPLSHTPTFASLQSMPSRPVILRVFVLANEEGGWQVLPGGLARLGTQTGIASMQQGGSSADVWVLSPTRLKQTQAMAPEVAFVASPQKHRLVTSRAAENLFWMGRYSERTENTLRLSRLALETLNSEAQHSAPLIEWLNSLCVNHGLVVPGVPQAQQSRRVFERSLIAGFWDTQHTTGVGYNLRAIKLAAAAVRERLSPEHWTLIEQTENAFFKPQSQDAPVASSVWAQQLLSRTSQSMAALTGAQTDRMTRDDGWRLLSIGRHIERLDFLAHALQRALETQCLHTQAGFDAVLALFDSTISFHAQYQQSRTLGALLELLLTHTDNPRALGWVAQTLRGRLAKMGHLALGATEEMSKQIPVLSALDLATLSPDGRHHSEALLQVLNDCRQTARTVSDQLNSLFFSHSGETQQSIGA
jgi:uncharacterized circularly permuted ATP-grasp superfamily protein/uncharacterized alpha-E superfamily protein